MDFTNFNPSSVEDLDYRQHNITTRSAHPNMAAGEPDNAPNMLIIVSYDQ